jgi:hypothetical protein
MPSRESIGIREDQARRRLYGVMADLKARRGEDFDPTPPLIGGLQGRELQQLEHRELVTEALAMIVESLPTEAAKKGK